MALCEPLSDGELITSLHKFSRLSRQNKPTRTIIGQYVGDVRLMTISAGVLTTGGYLTGKIVTKDRETLAVGGVGQVALPDRSVNMGLASGL